MGTPITFCFICPYPIIIFAIYSIISASLNLKPSTINIYSMHTHLHLFPLTIYCLSHPSLYWLQLPYGVDVCRIPYAHLILLSIHPRFHKLFYPTEMQHLISVSQSLYLIISLDSHSFSLLFFICRFMIQMSIYIIFAFLPFVTIFYSIFLQSYLRLYLLFLFHFGEFNAQNIKDKFFKVFLLII